MACIDTLTYHRPDEPGVFFLGSNGFDHSRSPVRPRVNCQLIYNNNMKHLTEVASNQSSCASHRNTTTFHPAHLLADWPAFPSASRLPLLHKTPESSAALPLQCSQSGGHVRYQSELTVVLCNLGRDKRLNRYRVKQQPKRANQPSDNERIPAPRPVRESHAG